MTRLTAAFLGHLALAAVACGANGDEDLAAYDAIVAESKACTAETECVVAGGVPGCRCEQAVEASAANSVDDAAAKAACDQERLACPTLSSPRCEQGACTADESF